MRAQRELRDPRQTPWRRGHPSQAFTVLLCVSPTSPGSPTGAGSTCTIFIEKLWCFAQSLELMRYLDKVFEDGDGERAFQVEITTGTRHRGANASYVKRSPIGWDTGWGTGGKKQH